MTKLLGSSNLVTADVDRRQREMDSARVLMIIEASPD